MKTHTTGTTNALPPFENARILVYGDIILDRYWYGNTSRISPEAPVPVVHVQDVQSRAGGAANVALNIAALESQVSLLGFTGHDPEAEILLNSLQHSSIEAVLQQVESHRTIAKVRVLGQGQQLLRMDFEKPFHGVDSRVLFAEYQRRLATTHVVVLSDYAKGALENSRRLIQEARAQNVPVLVDPKTNDFSCYAGATLITPNRKEFEAVVGPCADLDDIVRKAKPLIHQHDLEGLLVTCGKDGMILIPKEGEAVHLAARAQEVFDVTGAGDTVIGVMAAAIASGADWVQAANLANVAAGVVVGKLGAETVSLPELRRALQSQSGSQFGILSEEELIVTVSDAKAHNEKIIMTNGCFDILHAGHVQYLEQAKKMGDRLIVAVNDDTSVRRLKGSERPLNSLQQRMEVLASLRAVDWVVGFSEDTPARLISRILPDVLVKGGDYQIHEIAGSDVVIANGKEVVTIDLREGCSTTLLVEKIRGVQA